MGSGANLGITLGVRESEDVITVCQYAKQSLGYEHVVAMGTSQGGFSVLRASATLAGKTAIDGVIAENPYASVKELIEHIVIQVLGPAPFPFSGRIIHIALTSAMLFFIKWRISRLLRHGSNIATLQIDLREHMRKIHPLPVLLMHGTSDTLIPYTQSMDLFSYCKRGGGNQLVLFQGAHHTGLQNHG